MEYIPNGGQTWLPVLENTRVPTLPYTPLPRPEPPLPELALNQAARERGWVLTAQHQHFLPGVTAEMLDWWWANMEKGYYLWAPGSHKRFSWVRPPWQAGFLRSAHMISESVGQGAPVFGGSGVEIRRLDLSWYPFSTALEHVICEGVFNGAEEFVDSTVHLWQDVEGGCVHMDAAVASPGVSRPPDFVLEMLAADPEARPVAPSSTDHGEYEAARWPVFLPALYGLWKDHPDPSQSVPCCLKVRQTGPEAWEYLCENGPVTV